MHKTLLRQLQRYTHETPESLVSPWKEFVDAVGKTYEDFDQDRKLIERSLEVSSRELRQLIAVLQATFDATNEGIVVMDAKGRIANYNKSFLEMWGVPDAIMKTRDPMKAMDFIVELIHDPGVFRQAVEGAFVQFDTETDHVVHFKDGRVVEVHSKPQFLDGVSIGRLWSSRDITSRIIAEENLKTKIAALERLNKSMVDRELKMIELKRKLSELSKS